MLGMEMNAAAQRFRPPTEPGSTDEEKALELNGARILIADDQPDVLHALRMLLKADGYEVEMANTPRAVLERVQLAEFDAIIMDLNYTLDTTSGTEGMDLLAAVKAVDAALPVVVMTAWATIELAIEAMRRGACDFIQKPWDNAQVRDTVRSQVARRRRALRAARSRQGEIEDARSVQQALLPRNFPDIAGFELARWSRPAREVGGDYYDVLRIDDERVALVIADVSGKGIPAALTMSNLQGAVKTLALAATSPANLCRKLNQLLGASMVAGRFVSLFCGILEMGSGRLIYCNAGHQPSLAVSRPGGIVRLEAGGAVLGHFEDWHYENHEIVLEGGDSLLLLTDGIVDARNADDLEFGEQGIIAALPRVTADGAQALCNALTRAARQHCADQFEDDATLLVLHRKS